MTEERFRGVTDPPSKTKLFCPDCQYESEIDGEWIIEEADGREKLICPECELTVLDRSLNYTRHLQKH